MFEAAELKAEEADTSNDSFGKWIMEIEKYSPAEYYQDKKKYHDFFGIIEYIERFMAPAGLTGLWQVEKRGTEGILSAEERKQLDIQYARKFSFLLDVKIIFRTFTAFIQKENV